MNIQDMHNTFRTLGQQMGMQLIRAILPESIDVYLNDAIIEWTKEKLNNAIGIDLQSNGVGKAPTMSVINALRTLYKNTKLAIDTSNKDNEIVKYYDSEIGYYKLLIKEDTINPMMFLNFSISYEDKVGREFNCRIVNADDVNMMLSDYCSKPSKDYPIAVILSDTTYNNVIDIYTNYKNPIQSIDVKYIKYPNVVKYDDTLAQCVNCDLPDYVHYAIVERAVNKFFTSIGTRQPSQSQQQ